MSPKQSKPKTSKKKVAAAGALAAVPLAIALINHALLPREPGEPAAKRTAAAVACEEEVEDLYACHSVYPTGCSPTGKYDGYLNLLKNELPGAADHAQKYLTEADFETLEKALPADLKKSNHADFKDELKKQGEGELRGIVGYLYDAHVQDPESSNCGAPRGDSNQNVDFHIWIGFDADHALKIKQKKAKGALLHKYKQEAIVVEMTPHYRAQFHAQEWTIEALRAHFGEQVRVEGQLLVDNEHHAIGQDCGLKKESLCARATVWELHPVTGFQFCKRGEPCSQNSPDWADLGDETVVAGNTNPH